MSLYPIASDANRAAAADGPVARTASEASALAGGPVYLAIQEVSGTYKTIKDAEAAVPGLYNDPRFELFAREGQFGILVRYSRPAPAAPVARTAAAAARRPLGYAGTPEEARSLLGAPVERVSEPLWRPYATRPRALAQIAKAHLPEGIAEIAEREGRFVVQIAFWRPIAARLSPAERAEMDLRAASPLTPREPQLPADVGLFEQLAPENPAIVLAEEGDGRSHSD